jgi:hypothetical protein
MTAIMTGTTIATGTMIAIRTAIIGNPQPSGAEANGVNSLHPATAGGLSVI